MTEPPPPLSRSERWVVFVQEVSGLAVVTVACWVVLLLAAALPLRDAHLGFGGRLDRIDCGTFVYGLADFPADTTCHDEAVGRVWFLVVWAVLTGGASTAYVARAARGRHLPR